MEDNNENVGSLSMRDLKEKAMFSCNVHKQLFIIHILSINK